MRTRAEERRAAARKKTHYPRLMRRQQASEYLLEVHGLQFAPDTLAKFACAGSGPKIYFVNKIPFYRPTGLDVWAKAKISRPTTHAKKYTQPRNRNNASRRLNKQESPSPINTEPPAAAA
jgi:hypothetical protein